MCTYKLLIPSYKFFGELFFMIHIHPSPTHDTDSVWTVFFFSFFKLFGMFSLLSSSSLYCHNVQIKFALMERKTY